MTRILPLLLLTACASTLPPPSGTCGIGLGGRYDDRLNPGTLTEALLERSVEKVLDGAAYTTDWRLSYAEDSCRTLQGFTVYTRKPGAFMLDGTPVLGYTECWLKLIVVAEPLDGNWGHSALVHELFHAIQKCEAPAPIDSGSDAAHANWLRDNIYWAIDYENSQP